MPPRLKILTAGCKSNFADSSAIVRKALSLGYVLAGDGEGAELVVVNGCTVTHRADRDSRALVRRARREHPGARIVVTGCYAEAGGEAPEPLPEADLRVPPSADPSLAATLAAAAGRLAAPAGPGAGELSVHASDLLLGHRRTFLKVQDGCDARCSYCAIPLARGRERSLPPEEVLRLAVRAEASGAREIVLTGIHVGRYGADRGEKDGLASLLSRLLRETGEARFRLGSVEPLEVTAALVAAAAHPRVCPHFHVPLQSGSPSVLKRMGRPASPEAYRQAVRSIRASVPGARVGADVIAGFPGETEGEFAETLSLLSEEGIDYLHAFPYSARRGTAAALLPDDVAPREKKARVAALLARDREAREADMERRTGGIEEMIAERHEEGSGTLSGTTGSYHSVRVPGEKGDGGMLLRVRLAGRERGVFVAERLP